MKATDRTNDLSSSSSSTSRKAATLIDSENDESGGEYGSNADEEEEEEEVEEVDDEEEEEKDKFVEIIYCHGIDKLCAWTRRGRIYFVPNGLEENGVIQLASGGDALATLLNGTETADEPWMRRVDSTIAASSTTLQADTVDTLHGLIGFDTAKVNFSAKFPVNWTPVLNEQHQQRKHPQHIHAESVNFTKCWKHNVSANGGSGAATTTINNASSMLFPGQQQQLFDDFNIEIYLNKPVQIACIQLKVKFSKWLSINSNYELRLFKQNKLANNGGLNSADLQSVDNGIDFNLKSRHELIFGPVNLRDYLDLTNSKTYMITICSSKLYETL